MRNTIPRCWHKRLSPGVVCLVIVYSLQTQLPDMQWSEGEQTAARGMAPVPAKHAVHRGNDSGGLYRSKLRSNPAASLVLPAADFSAPVPGVIESVALSQCAALQVWTGALHSGRAPPRLLQL